MQVGVLFCIIPRSAKRGSPLLFDDGVPPLFGLRNGGVPLLRGSPPYKAPKINWGKHWGGTPPEGGTPLSKLRIRDPGSGIRDAGYTTLELRPLKKWTRQNDWSRREASNGGLESFWDAQGVEIEAKQFLTFQHGIT